MDRLEIIKTRLNNEERGFDNGEYLHLEDVSWLIEQIDKLQTENNRYKDINQGLLEVQLSLVAKENEYKQWFEVASKNVNDKDALIKQLEEDITFFKKRQDVNKQVTRELATLNDIRVIEILTKTRIIGEQTKDEMTAEKFLKGINSLSDKCGSCKFFDTTKNQCKEIQIAVNYHTPKCSKWRYFG